MHQDKRAALLQCLLGGGHLSTAVAERKKKDPNQLLKEKMLGMEKVQRRGSANLV